MKRRLPTSVPAPLMMPRRPGTRWFAAAAALLIVLVAPLVGASTPMVQAAPVQTVPVRHGDYTYTVDVAAGVVQVIADIRVANDSAEGGRKCYTDFHLPVPIGATRFRATDRADVLATEVLAPADGASFTDLEVTLLDCLDYGRQVAVRVTYDLPGGAPRSTAPARVGAGHVAFLAWGAGRAGGASITVVAPTSLPLDALGPDWKVTVEGATTTYFKRAVADPSTYRVLIAGRDDTAAAVEEFTVDGHRFELRGWPGDAEWLEHVRAVVTDGLPALEAAIGTPWPVDSAYVLHEAYTPGGLGATNWPTVAGGAPTSEQLDQRAVLRGLAGAWFGSNRYTDQWLAEGLADVYTDTALEQLGGVPATVFYGPTTAAVAAVVADVGTEQMPAMLTHLDDGTGAYDTGDTFGAPAGWQRFLDVAEEIGGSEQAATLLEPLLAEADRLLLTGRAEAREQYAALQEHGGDWAPPLGVRRLMENWSFTEATALITDAEVVLGLRDELATDLEGTGVSLPADLRAAYEAAVDDLDDVADAIDERAAVAPVLAAAVAADSDTGGVLDWLGLIGSDVEGALADARAAFAAGDGDLVRAKSREVIDAAGGATFEGLKRLLLAGGLALAALVVALTIRSFRSRRSTTAELGSDA